MYAKARVIFAQNYDGVIGVGGKLPAWKCPRDMAHFRDSTMGHTVIMGRTTFDSIGRELPGRKNIVVTRDRSFFGPSVIAYSIKQAITLASGIPWIIGGAEVISAAIAADLVSEISVTEIPFSVTNWKDSTRMPFNVFQLDGFKVQSHHHYDDCSISTLVKS